MKCLVDFYLSVDKRDGETTRQWGERLGWLPETFIAVNADNEPEFASSLTDEERLAGKNAMLFESKRQFDAFRAKMADQNDN